MNLRMTEKTDYLDAVLKNQSGHHRFSMGSQERIRVIANIGSPGWRGAEDPIA